MKKKLPSFFEDKSLSKHYNRQIFRKFHLGVKIRKILIVCSGNSGGISPFVKELAESIRNESVYVECFLIEGKGAFGYLGNLGRYRRLIREYKPDIVHAHYGLSGLFANMQRRVPVVSTFHGSDINTLKIRLFSSLAMKLSKHNIFVSRRIAEKALAKRKHSIIPCGVDMKKFFPIKKEEARARLNMREEEKIVLFSGSFDMKVKNYALAKSATDLLKYSIKLIEMKGYSREQVNLFLNACDVALMTSFAEGSPQFIKEAMACNCPIVSTDVGDVRNLISNTNGCYISSFNEKDVADKLSKALLSNGRTSGRDNIRHLNSSKIANSVLEVYKYVLQ